MMVFQSIIPYGYEKSTGGSVTQLNSGYSIDLKTNRPPTSVFPQEFFVEDFTWNSNTDESYLDENNGRFGITPEYPNGTICILCDIRIYTN